MFDVNYLDLKKNDILIVHFNKDVGAHEMNQIIDYLKKYVPEHDILAANSYYINGMTVIHQETPRSDDSVWGY